MRNHKKSLKHKKKSQKNKRKSIKTVIKHKNRNNKKHSLKKMKHGHKKRVLYSNSRGHRKGLLGGNCGCNGMVGGMVSSPAAGPVGYSWNGGNPSSWPGVSASQGTTTNNITMSNHFKTSPNGISVGGVDPYSGSSHMNGGKKNKKNNQKGGFFQEIVNLGRGAQYGLSSGYYNLIGKEQPISENPYPTQDQPIDSDYKIIGTQPPNVKNMYINANKQVAKL